MVIKPIVLSVDVNCLNERLLLYGLNYQIKTYIRGKMIKNLTIVEGLEDAENVSYVINIAKTMLKAHTYVTYFDFNKANVEEMSELVNPSPYMQCFTLDGFCFKELKSLNLLPKYEDFDSSKQEKSQYFQNTHRNFIQFFSNYPFQFKFIKDDSVIVVNHFQNIFNEDLLNILVLISKNIDIDLYILGNSFDYYYSCIKSDPHNFDHINEIFQSTVDDNTVIDKIAEHL